MHTFVRRFAALAAAAVFSSSCSTSDGGGPAPFAHPGFPVTATKRSMVMLDGTGSRPPEGYFGPLRFRWTQTAGTPVTLSDPASPTPTFLAPGVSGALTFSLVVTASRPSEPAAVTVTVVNQPPVAWAGPDLSVRAEWLATLDAQGSWDPDGDPLTVTWVQTSGPAVILDAPAPGRARFTAPLVQGFLAFLAVVSDGEAVSDDEVTVRVLPPGANLPPTADAGADLDVSRGALVTLSGSGTDPDGFPVALAWEQVSGPPVVLAGAGSANPTFVAPLAAADLEFRLTASDGMDAAFDTVTVRVRNLPPVITSVLLSPAHPRTADDLSVEAAALDPEGDAVTLAYAWRRNGADEPGQEGSTFPASLTVKGDVVAVTVTASDGTATATATASATIEDSPPELRVTVPAEVLHGTPLAGSVASVDPDGDPLPPGAVSLAYGPAGMEVAADGTISWTPALPMFDRALEVAFGVELSGAAPAAAAGTIRVVDPARDQALRRTGIEIARNSEAMRARDLDGDGRDELLVSGLAGPYELRDGGGVHEIAWMLPYRLGGPSDVFAGPSSAIEAADLDGDRRAEIFVSEDELLVRLDGVTRREVQRTAAPAGERWRACEIADVDLDGRLELACLLSDDGAWYATTGRLAVLDAGTFAVEFETATLAIGGSLAIGDVDGDAALEIVTSGGFVYDGATHANEWAYTPGFGGFVEIGRLQPGGAVQIVAGTPLRGFSATLKSPLWEAPSDTGAAPFLLRDVDGDGADEIVSTGDFFPAVQAHRFVGGPAPLELVFSATVSSSYFGGAATIAAGDLDGDGEVEVAFDGGAGSTGEDSLLVAGPISAAAVLERANVDPSQLDGPMRGGRLARTGPGGSRLVFQSTKTDSGYAGSRVVLLDPATGAVSVSAEIGSNWANSSGVAVADYDGDGVDEVFLGTASLYDAYFAAWDPATDTVPWTAAASTSFSSSGIAAVAAADMNADGVPDLVGLSVGTIWVYDVRGQTLVWKSTSLGYARAMEVADLDRDGRPEVVVGAGTRVLVYRWSAEAGIFVEAASATVPDVIDLALGDCDGDGLPEVYVLGGPRNYYSETTVTRLDAALASLGAFTTPRQAATLFLEDLGTARKNLAVAMVDRTSVYGDGVDVLAALDPETGEEIWRSPPLFGAVQPDSATWLQAGGTWRLVLATTRSMYLTR